MITKRMVTIVVPVFNMEAYLPRCMDSLLGQTYQQTEILIIDDGSTDNSMSLCEEYCRRFQSVRVIHKENGGLSSARNMGIESASGEYITFPDPDDWVENSYIENYMALVKEYNPDMVCIGHYVDFEDATFSANPGASFRLMNGEEAMNALILPPAMEGFAWNKLYKMDIIRQYHLRFSDLMGTTEDLAFAYQYLKHVSKVCFAPDKIMYHYCQRTGSATIASFSQRQMQSMNIYEQMIRESKNGEFREAATIRLCDLALNLLWSVKNQPQRDRPIEKQLREKIEELKRSYLKSTRVRMKRKLQCACALFSPTVYCLLKNNLSRKNKK